MFFASNQVVLNQDLMSNTVSLNDVNYNHNVGTCMLTSVYYHK